MTDRKGISFPVLREWEHRNVVYNSLPVGMSDRGDRLMQCDVVNRHFIFSTETPAEVNEVVRAYRSGHALRGTVRRING